MRVLSIQSHVSWGHVGNAAAVFPLQRLGHDVLPVHTVLFSNHTGYAGVRGPLIPAADVAAVVTGLDEVGALASVDAVLSGYLGAPDMGSVVLDAVARVKSLNPAARYACDPVIGDAGRGVFVQPGVPEFLRDHALPAADVLTPNQFELDFLAGGSTSSLADVLAAADELRSRGPRDVLVTSVDASDDPNGPDGVAMVAVSDDGAWSTTTPLLPLVAAGAGDLTAALYLAHLTASGPAMGLARTASSVHAVLQRTLAAGSRELEIVAAQDSIARPLDSFEVRRLR